VTTSRPPRPIFGVDRRRRSRVFFLVAALITAGIATGIAFYLDDDASTAPAAQAEPAPSAVAAATPAGPDDVVEPEAAAEGDPEAAEPSSEAVSADDASETADPVEEASPAAGSPEDGDSSESATADDAQDEAAGEEEAAPPPAEPVPPSVSATPQTVVQGRTTLVVLAGDVEADRVFVSIDGYTGEMVFEDGVGWVGFVPVHRLAGARRYNVVVDTFDKEVYETTFLGELFVEAVEGETEQITLDPDTAALLAPELVAIDNETRFEQYVVVSGPRLWTLPWRMPVQGAQSSPFGMLRSFNGAPPTDWHHGQDFEVAEGEPIVAPAPGRVVFATELPVHGQGVILDHGAGVYSGYWHMSAITVEVDDFVISGQTLGLVGSTGLSTGPHLHWEVIVQGQDVDPIQWTESTFG